MFDPVCRTVFEIRLESVYCSFVVDRLTGIHVKG